MTDRFSIAVYNVTMPTVITTKTTLPDEREFTGWMPHMLTNSVPTEGLSTNRDLEKELWSILEYYLIDDVAKSLFSRQKITDKKLLNKLLHDFQSYIHQARNFYDYARNSDYRSSSLLFLMLIDFSITN